jgi:NTE family protein
MALHAISLLTHRRLIADIELHSDDAQLIVLPSACPLRIQPIDFGHANDLIARVLQDGRAFLNRADAHQPPIRRRTRKPRRHAA